MSGKDRSKVNLTGYDDLFQTEESRADIKAVKIREIPLREIDDFPHHPFQVRMDEDMQQLIESIERNGVLTPAVVRQKEDGRYELVSGHRRKFASIQAGKDTMPCEVKELTRDQATIEMVEGNLQRSEILPSEKAYAYRMRLEAMKRQGQRTDLTSTPVVSKSRTNEELGESVGESREQVRRYIRLTYLIPELIQMVDEKRIAFRPAVELSYLPIDQQQALMEAMAYQDATPSLAQAIKIKRYSQNGKLTEAVMQSIMEEIKPNQREKPAFRDERITKLIPKSVPKGQENEFVIKALEHYNKFLQRRKAQER